MNAAVFISHSSKDRKTALTICGALEHRGVRCWIASRDVRPGTNFEESVVQAIRLARVMVLVFTANANNSDEMKKEIVLAGQHRLVVIPVRAEDVVPNDAFAYEFATRQWIDLFENWENAIEGLVSQIEFTLGEHPDPQKRDVSPSMSRSTFAAPHARNWPVIIGIVVSAVLLMAAGIGAVSYFSAPAVIISTAPVKAVASTVKSLPSDDDVMIRFINKTKEPLQLVWIDFVGQEHIYGTVPAGGSFAQPTFTNHVWVTRTLSGRELSRYVATGNAKDFQVEITGDSDHR